MTLRYDANLDEVVCADCGCLSRAGESRCPNCDEEHEPEYPTMYDCEPDEDQLIAMRHPNYEL